MIDETYDLHAWWGSRPLSVPQCAEVFRAFVNALAEFDPVFSSWLHSRPSDKPYFDVPLDPAEAARLMEKAQSRYDLPSDRLWPELGYVMGARNSGPPQYYRRDQYAAATGLNVGCYGTDEEHRNRVEIRVSKRRIATDRPWRASELCPLMKLVNCIWQPRELSIDCWRYGKFAARIPDKRYEPRKMKLPPGAKIFWPTGERVLFPWVGWLTYLPLCDEPFTIDNPVHMARARAMEAAIRPVQS